MSNQNSIKKRNNKINIIQLIWIIAVIFEWINIALFLAAMGDPRISFDWYRALYNYEHKVILFYIVSAIDASLFSILVMVHRNRRELYDMLMALLCFSVQIFLLMWKIKI